MQKIISFSVIAFFFTSLFSCANKGFLKEGIYSYKNIYTNYDSSIQLELMDTSEVRTWFCDSAVIFENNYLLSMEEGNELDGTYKIENRFMFFRFIYLDLRTMKCQDYMNFKDTALPIDNYVYEAGGNFSLWRFFSTNVPTDTSETVYLLPDTVINHKNYRRVKVRNHDHTIPCVTDYYLDCEAKNSILHIDPTIEKKYPGCKVVRRTMKHEIFPYSIELKTKLIADTLSKLEKAVFVRWAKNARETNLPLLKNRDELGKFIVDHHELMNKEYY